MDMTIRERIMQTTAFKSGDTFTSHALRQSLKNVDTRLITGTLRWMVERQEVDLVKRSRQASLYRRRTSGYLSTPWRSKTNEELGFDNHSPDYC